MRWVAGGASAALAAWGGLTLTASIPAHAAVSPGTGSSYAQSLQITPHDGSLAVGVVLGEALAGHTNDSARAQSQGTDLGAIGTSLTSFNCGSNPTFQPDQIPQPLETETGETGASQGITQTLDPSTGASQPSFGSTEFVQANATPYGEADTSLASVNQGAFSLSGIATRAWSGVVDGVREAGATSDVGDLSIAGGLVQLKGLHWESVYPSGGTQQPTGSFTIGSLQIAGIAIPVTQDESVLTNLINTALGTVGLELLMPTSSVTQGVQTVTPLQIEAVPNDSRDNLLNLALNATQTEQQELFGGLENGFFPSEPAQLEQLLCQSDTPITVLDVAIASVNGGGYLSAGIGGVNSSSANVASNPYSLGFPAPVSIGGTPGTPAIAPTIGSSGSGSSGSLLTTTPSVTGSAPPATLAGAAPAPPSTTSSPSSERSTSPTGIVDTAAIGHAPGGPLLAIGLAGLGLIGLLAEGDRRMMRRAQHTAQFEE